MKLDDAAPITLVRLIRVAPNDFDRLYGEIATFLQMEAMELTGCIDAQLLGNEDSTRILILVKWHSRKAWSRAQWDCRLGELIEEIVTAGETLEFNLYSGDCFAALNTA
ncbi:MAG TPA: hypothetical protein VHR97_04630 [Candidatus Baltobacteraceae bacterium]|jgi:hypothetical protein|nr:hypothetical protein [Candidatus Baltobacteraceae bacterium]